MSASLPLALPSAPPLQDTPFGSDKLERAPLAKVLSGYIKRLKFGAVIAVDAEWGQGKTWFARNWEKLLENEGHAVIYIDAFESDYVGDPFSLIAGEIFGLIQSRAEKKKFLESATSVALAIAPTVLKAAIRGGGKALLGVADLDEKLKEGAEKIVENAEDPLGKFLEERIKGYQDGKKSVAAFRKNLSKFAAEKDKPFVVIIDELDRCRPEFAVSLLERIKHFFDVENVVFVLFMNKEQMHSAIKGVYGQATDAHTYLEKFLNFTFTLEQPRFGKIQTFVDAELAKYEMVVNTQMEEFVSGLCVLTDVFNFTPRQVERAISLLALAYPIKTAGILLSELVVLKIARPDLLKGFLLDDPDLHKQLLKMLGDQKGRYVERRRNTFELDFLIQVHTALLESDDGVATKELLDNWSLRKEKIRRDYADLVKLFNMAVR